MNRELKYSLVSLFLSGVNSVFFSIFLLYLGYRDNILLNSVCVISGLITGGGVFLVYQYRTRSRSIEKL